MNRTALTNGLARVVRFNEIWKVAALALALAYSQSGFAGPAANVPHIGYLSVGSEASNGVFLEALKDGLRELGYIDGRNIQIDMRWAGTSPDQFSDFAAALARTRPAAIIGTCIPSTRAAKDATATIPIVMSVDGDPVAAGLVSSLARPGGNVTGTSTLFEELVPKWLEFLTAAMPKARVVAALVDPDDLADPYFWAKLQQAAQHYGVKIMRSEVRTVADLKPAFANMKRRHVDAFVVMTNAMLAGEAKRIVALADKYKLPGMYSYREFAEAGGLMSYGLSYRAYYKGVSRYVDKVLKGAKPADLPVEQPTRIEFVINLATARKLGVTIPEPLLVRADAVLN